MLKEYFGVEHSLGLAYSQAAKVKDTVYIAGQGQVVVDFVIK